LRVPLAHGDRLGRLHEAAGAFGIFLEIHASPLCGQAVLLEARHGRELSGPSMKRPPG
jgi:hypothetical protein